MNPPSESSGERQRPDSARKSHLPKLAPAQYTGGAFVHWTLTLEQRATRWLTPNFHHHWQLTLLHASSLYRLICPCYVLMPDHIHLLWLGRDVDSDQRNAISLLRKQLLRSLTPYTWQKQAHDHVLREPERISDAFEVVAHYIFENPVRAGLASNWSDYPYNGNCLPGYPELDPRQPDYWPRFWRLYNYLVEKAPD